MPVRTRKLLQVRGFGARVPGEETEPSPEPMFRSRTSTGSVQKDLRPGRHLLHSDYPSQAASPRCAMSPPRPTSISAGCLAITDVRFRFAARHATRIADARGPLQPETALMSSRRPYASTVDSPCAAPGTVLSVN